MDSERHQTNPDGLTVEQVGLSLPLWSMPPPCLILIRSASRICEDWLARSFQDGLPCRPWELLEQ